MDKRLTTPPSAAWGGSPLEDLTMWAMFQPKTCGKPDIAFIKENVYAIRDMAMQKAAGQRKGGKDISWDNLDRVKWNILIEACLLVLSGALDGLEEKENEDDKKFDEEDACGNVGEKLSVC